MVVDGYGYCASDTGEIATDHEYDTKFTEGVGESKNKRGEYTGKGKWENDPPEGAPGVCAENVGGGDEFWIEAFERGDERLNAKRKAVENAGDDEAHERECERLAEESEPEFAKQAAGAHGDEEIKAEDSRRKNKRKSDDGLDEEFGTEFRESEPVGDGQGDNEKNRRDEEGKAEREKKFGHEFRKFILEWTDREIRG